MIDPNRHILDSYARYPSEQWRFAIGKFRAPSNRPPSGFWREQRNNAIAFLQSHGIDAREFQGNVYIGEDRVDGSYVE